MQADDPETAFHPLGLGIQKAGESLPGEYRQGKVPVAPLRRRYVAFDLVIHAEQLGQPGPVDHQGIEG
jgi:hypothetical protein